MTQVGKFSCVGFPALLSDHTVRRDWLATRALALAWFLVTAGLALALYQWRLQHQLSYDTELLRAKVQSAALVAPSLEDTASMPILWQPRESASPDFSTSLPEQAEVEPLISLLQKVALTQKVVLVSVGTVAKPATEFALGRVDVAMQLRGSYLDIKRVVASVLQRHGDNLALRRFTFRKSPASGSNSIPAPAAMNLAEVDAQVDWVLLSQPLPSPPKPHVRVLSSKP